MRQAFKGTRKWVAVSIAAGLAMTVVLAMTFAGSATGAAAGVSYVSVPGAAFTSDPEGEGYCDYTRDGYSGQFTDEDGCEFEAGVDLPHGSFVTGVWAYYSSDVDGTLHFEENDSFGGHDDIANMGMHSCIPSYPVACVAVASSAHLCSQDIDNFHFGYGIWVNPSDPGFTLYRVVIRYIMPTAGQPKPTSCDSPSAPTPANPSKNG